MGEKNPEEQSPLKLDSDSLKPLLFFVFVKLV